MKMSTIKLSQKTKNKLVNLRLTDAETYENIVIRLINSYMRDKMKIELISKEETSNPYGKKLIIYRYYNEKMNDIIDSMDEVVEGVRTVRIAYQLAKSYQLRVPIIQMIYSVIFESFELDKAIQFLMRYPFGPDVDFI